MKRPVCANCESIRQENEAFLEQSKRRTAAIFAALDRIRQLDVFLERCGQPQNSYSRKLLSNCVVELDKGLN